MYLFSAFAIGLLFGLGLILSGLTDPGKVLGFLDLAGNWDPSLLFTMGGAILVSALGFRLAHGRATAVLGAPIRGWSNRSCPRERWSPAWRCSPSSSGHGCGAANLPELALLPYNARSKEAEEPMHVNPIQLFDAESSTFTYILAAANGEAAIIDPVDQHCERDLAHLRRLGLCLAYTLETHAHADHVTSSGRLRELTGARAAAPSGCGIAPADLQLQDGDVIAFGGEEIAVLHTPGHTAGSVCFLWRANLFTGDTLLIDGCGRTDFQGGCAGALYDSAHGKLFALPDATRVWPGHDYRGQSVSTIGWERAHNARLANRPREDFIALMGALDLPRPKLIDVALPANRRLGLPHAA